MSSYNKKLFSISDNEREERNEYYWYRKKPSLRDKPLVTNFNRTRKEYDDWERHCYKGDTNTTNKRRHSGVELTSLRNIYSNWLNK